MCSTHGDLARPASRANDRLVITTLFYFGSQRIRHSRDLSHSRVAHNGAHSAEIPRGTSAASLTPDLSLGDISVTRKPCPATKPVIAKDLSCAFKIQARKECKRSSQWPVGRAGVCPHAASHSQRRFTRTRLTRDNQAQSCLQNPSANTPQRGFTRSVDVRIDCARARIMRSSLAKTRLTA
jgi:hypothetical protein